MKNKFGSSLKCEIWKASVLGPVLFLFLLSPSLVKAGDHSMVLCRKDKAVRTLRVEKLGPDRCRALYSKSGIEQVIGANTRIDQCMSYVEGVKGTLETASWTCKAVKVSTQNDVQGEH